MLLAISAFLILIVALFFLTKKTGPTPTLPQNPTPVTVVETPSVTLHKSNVQTISEENSSSSHPELPQESEFSMEPRESGALEELTIKKTHSSLECLRQDTGEDLQIRGSSSLVEDLLETLPTQQAEPDQKSNESKKTVFKGFNFRNKKGSFNAASENTVSTNPDTVELTPNNQFDLAPQTTQEQSVDAFETTLLKESSITSNSSAGDVNNATKPPLRGKGFNFRNPGTIQKKTTVNSTTTQTSGTGSQPTSQNSSPAKNSSSLESSFNKENSNGEVATQPKDSETQDKKVVRGFNFRNANKVKVE